MTCRNSMDFQFQIGDELKTIKIDREGEVYRAQIGDRVYQIAVEVNRTNELIFAVNNDRHTTIIASSGSKYFVSIDGDVIELSKPDARQARRGKLHHGDDSLSASMRGQVTRVLVNDGDAVERGQALVVLEAMKMEIKVTAPHAGRVAKVHAQLGQVVDRGQVLIEIQDSPVHS